MKKRIMCALLAAVLLFGIVSIAPFEVKAAASMSASEECIALVKDFEGFSKFAYKDGNQWSVGWGTSCTEADRQRYLEQGGITEEEANSRLMTHLANKGKYINKLMDKYSFTMTQNQFDAMLLMTYNCGQKWTTEYSGTLNRAVREGKTGNEFIFAITLWCNINGTPARGLIRRRLAEANLYLNGVEDGVYTLCAFPIKLSELEAAPCRAVLVDEGKGL